MLEFKKHPDATFLVDGKIFSAHKVVLEERAPVLSSLASDWNGTEIQIPDEDESTFEALLRYIYTDTLPSSVDIKKHTKTLLEVANKYACTSLKLLSEAELAASRIIIDNAAELLLIAL